MATYAENLITARDNLAAQLADISASPKPTYTDGSRTVSWETYYAMLTARMAELNKLIAQSDHVEVQTVVRPW